MDPVAVYGAITGTVAIGWQIYTRLRERTPRVQVALAGAIESGPFIAQGGTFASAEGWSVELIATNVGERAITIAQAWFVAPGCGGEQRRDDRIEPGGLVRFTFDPVSNPDDLLGDLTAGGVRLANGTRFEARPVHLFSCDDSDGDAVR